MKKKNIQRKMGRLVSVDFCPSDILSLISIGDSTKSKESNKYSGNKGIGFKNIYQLFDKVIVDSNGYRFLLDDTYEVDLKSI